MAISIGRLRGGFCVYWTDETGRRRRYQLAARTRAEAEAEARDRYARETIRASGATVTELWEGYRAHLGSRPTAETLKHSGKSVLAYFGALRPDQITVQDCRDYRSAMKAAGKSDNTVHTYLGHLRSALKWARKSGHLDRVPLIELPSKPDSAVNPLSEAQMRALVDGCHAPHVRLAVVLLLATGARRGAILDLTWERVDFARGRINLRLPDGATRKGRAIVPMNRMARAALEAAYPARLTDYVVEWGGKPVKSIATGYKAALRRAGLEGVNVHQIRHSVAVRMLEAGIRIDEVSQFLGHSNIQTTMKVYARFRPEHLADAAEVMNVIDIKLAAQKVNR